MKRKSSNSYLASIQTFLEGGWVALKKLYFANAIEIQKEKNACAQLCCLKLHHQAPTTSALLSCWSALKSNVPVALLIHDTRCKNIFIYFFFCKLASGRNPPNPPIWLVSRAGGFFTILPAGRESLAASFTSLFVVCEWTKPVKFKPFFF